MRIDKFLKESKLIKRRTLAKEATDTGRVKINGNVAKAGSKVEAGDIISIDYVGRQINVRVEEGFDEKVNPKADQLYKIID